MLLSIECKKQIMSLRAQIKALVDDKKDVPEELQNKYDAKKAEYTRLLEAEAQARSSVNGGNKAIDRKLANKSLKAFLLNGKQDDHFKNYFSAAKGNNGAEGGDGGVLIPSVLLPVAEINKDGADLRSVCTKVAVTTRSGKVPVIDYAGGDVALTKFEENNDIAEQKAVFTSVPFSLEPKGAIIPVSRELLLDSESDVLSIIGTLFNRVYMIDCNRSIAAKIVADTADSKKTAQDINDAIDDIKKKVITTPTVSGNINIVTTKTAWATLACAKDVDGRYLLARDANNSTIKMIEGRNVILVDDVEMADTKTVLVGDFGAMYHIAYPELEVASSAEAGFRSNSVLVRAVCRFDNMDVYKNAFAQIVLPA